MSGPDTLIRLDSQDVLLLGAGGLLAGEIKSRWQKINAVPREDCDITDINRISEICESRPKVIINCAAMTDLNYCEEHVLEAWNVNVVGVKNIAKVAVSIGAYMVHVSSNYAVNPVNEYGRMKLASEKFIPGLVLRTAFYNRDHWLFRSLEEGCHVALLTNYYFNPITTAGLLDYMEELIGRGYRGVVNIGTRDRITYHDFGLKLCGEFGFDKGLIDPVQSLKLGYEYPGDSYLELDQLEEIGLQTRSISEDFQSL
jgi:dTDP-4-dehydrorhamnose reductase